MISMACKMYASIFLGMMVFAASGSAVQSEVPKVPNKEFWTPGCVPSPLPTTPVGDTVSVVASGTYTAGNFTVRVTGWRVRCSDTDYQTLFTFAPLSGQVYPGSLGVTLIQGGFQYFSGIGASGPLLVPETSRISWADGVPGAPEFDDDRAFDVVFADLIFVTLSRLSFPAAPSSPVQALGLRGAFSGSWFDSGRPGQGLMLEFGKVAARRVAFVTWYTQINGQQAWIVGNRDYNDTEANLTLDLYRSEGGTFPNTGGPAGALALWGSGTLRFVSCSQLVFTYQSVANGSGQISMVRGMEGGIDGLPCQN